jgi:hypothetical protein
MELHVGQQRIPERAREWKGPGPFVIWDVGLGPAGNALCAIGALRNVGRAVEIHSFEIDTSVLEFALSHAGELGYLAGWEESVRELLLKGRTSPLPSVTWHLHRGDFSRGHFPAGHPSAIFFDPYSPARNAEMWSLELFRDLRRAAGSPDAPDCMMTNYTRSTSVRVTMALAGWFVGVGIRTGEKDETTIAANRPGLLRTPLDASWLSRVRSSTNASPLRGESYGRGPISAEDYSLLVAHPQFL